VKWFLNRGRAAGAALVFVAGLVMGGLLYAAAGPYREMIEPSLQNAAILAAGAIITGFLALAGALAAASVVSSEGEATRRAGAEASRIDRRRELVTKLTVLSNRHAQEIRDQRAAWDGWNRVKPLPIVNPTTEIEDMVNELYSLGFQETGDEAQLLFRCLVRMDAFTYTAGSSPVVLDQDTVPEFYVWVRMQIELKTRLIDVSLRDRGVDKLVPGNRHWDAELNEMRNSRMNIVLVADGPMTALKGPDATA
jgi:hypothetical protein